MHGQMLRSLYQGQQIIIQDLHRLSLHLQMDPPLTTLEAYRQQVAWPGDQPSTDRGEEPSGAAATEDPAVDEDLMADMAGADWGPWADLGGDN